MNRFYMIKPKMILIAVSFCMFALTRSYSQYVVSDCDFDPMTTDGTTLCLGDDEVSSAVPLGFTFHFYDQDFTQCYISSNGYLSFNSGLPSGCCTGVLLPSATYPYSIFFAQEDLDPNTCVDGTISYYTTGAPGSQIFVMSFVDVPHYPGPTGTFNVTCQVQLYEGTNEIRIVTTEYNSDGGSSTMGLNKDGVTATPVPDRNSTNWSAYNECKLFSMPAVDVGVSAITSPSTGPDLTGTESVTVEITNYGTSDATDIPVSYDLDGGAPVMETALGTLSAGASESYTFTATADFSEIGCHTINAYTSLDGDETPGDDAFSKSVCHNSGNAYYIHSNVESEPWGSTSNPDAMNANFGVDGWQLVYNEDVVPADIFNSSTCFVWLEGSDQLADELETFLTANLSTIEDWVSNGGHLLLNAAPNEGDGMSYGFGDFNLVYPNFADAVTAVDPTHPIFVGPFTPVSTTYTGTSFAHAYITGTGGTNLLTDDGTGFPVLVEYPYGSGDVMFGGMTTDNFHAPMPDAANFLANIVAYLGCAAPETCDIPGGLYADGITGSSADLHWSSTGAEQYTVSLYNLTTGEINKKHVTGATSIALSGGLTPSTTYGFRVKSMCYGLGERSDYSDFYYFTTGVGRIGEFGDNSVQVYPNPTNGNFTVQLNGYSDNVEILVVNAIGQKVYDQFITVTDPEQTQQINLSNVENGVYLVKVISGNKTNVSSLMIGN